MISEKLPVNSSASATDMANSMFGAGVTVVSATYYGDDLSSGTYSNGLAVAPNAVPADTGVILSTGHASDFTNESGELANVRGNTSTDTGGVDGDPLMSGLIGRNVYDAAIFEAEFYTSGDTLSMQLVFGSEEYLEWVDSGYNDVVGIWVNGEKASMMIGDGDISIDNINTEANQNLFIDNGAGTLNTEMDGLTRVLTVKAPVNSGSLNTIRIGIADDGDSIYDSNLLIVGDSVQTFVIARDDYVTVARKSERTLDLRDNDTAGNDATITKINGQSVVPGDIVSLQTGESVRLNADGTVTVFAAGAAKVSTISYTLEGSDGTNDLAFLTITTSPVDGTGGDDHMMMGFIDNGGQIIDGADGYDDVIFGYGGNDKIFSGIGDDDVKGGSGDDFIRGGLGADLVDGGDGNDVVDGGAGSDTMSGGNGNDVYYIYDAGDVLTGETGGHDKVKSAFDHVLDDPFEDLWLIEGSAARNGTGNGQTNTIVGNSDENTLIGLAGNDVIIANGGADTIDGGTGADRIYGGMGADDITGAAGADTIFGGAGADVISGGTGNDTICAGGGDDALIGGDGNDLLGGGTGVDTMEGGDGNDKYIVGHVDDVVIESADSGLDRVRSSVDYTLPENVEDLLMIGASVVGTGNNAANVLRGSDQSNVLSGLGGNDRLVGKLGDDLMDGGNGRDTGNGGKGADTIIGGAGNDKLSGNSGEDVINGGTGNDRLSGGSEADMFVFNAGDGNDTLHDFDPVEDTLEFGGVVAADLSVTDHRKGIKLSYSESDSVYLVGLAAVEFENFDIQFV